MGLVHVCMLRCVGICLERLDEGVGQTKKGCKWKVKISGMRHECRKTEQGAICLGGDMEGFEFGSGNW